MYTQIDNSPLVTSLPMSEINLAYRALIEKDAEIEKVKHKISQQRMLDSLFDTSTGECHANSDELMKMVQDEYRVNLVEVSSGNGSAHNVFNMETLEYDVLISASCTATRNDSKGSLDNMLVDSDDGIVDKNEDSYVETIDGVTSEHVVCNSNYSLWDTIAENAALIVRHTGHWQGAHCAFDKKGYKKREKARLVKRHNRLMETSSTFTGNSTKRKASALALNADKKGNKVLTRLAKAARRGQQWAIDDLIKIGYNEF